MDYDSSDTNFLLLIGIGSGLRGTRFWSSSHKMINFRGIPHVLRQGQAWKMMENGDLSMKHGYMCVCDVFELNWLANNPNHRPTLD